MKTVVQVKLMPSPIQAAALEATLSACNSAANHAAQVSFRRDVKSRNDLQVLVYGDLRSDFGLGAQAAVRVVKKVVDAYTTLKSNVKSGNLGKPGSKRRTKAESAPVGFRSEAAQPFDDRMLSWQHDAGTVSIWTVCGRLKGVQFVGQLDQLKILRQHRQGETDLACRNGKWFLVATCETPEEAQYKPIDWIGVDRGIVNLASTSDADNYTGRRLNRYRRCQARIRAELQAKQTRSANRRLKARSRKEAQHAKQVNHVISKEIVAVAKRTGRGIALEQLRTIRDRVRPRRDQRAALSSWPFHQLGTFIAYKARRAGVPFIEVDAAYTSQKCPHPWCGHTARNNRPCRDEFRCRSCGLAGPADIVAAVNVRNRARLAWGFVNSPVLQGT